MSTPCAVEKWEAECQRLLQPFNIESLKQRTAGRRNAVNCRATLTEKITRCAFSNVVTLAGLTVLVLPAYAQIRVSATNVFLLTTTKHTEHSLPELTREVVSTIDHTWSVRQLPVQKSSAGQKSCSMCGVLAGVGLGFAAHESGHLFANLTFSSDVFTKRVKGLGVPFFAISHHKVLSRRREFVVSSAGLWAQFAAAEWILTKSPSLRSQRASLSKGLLAFHVVTSALYGVAGLGKVGPPERDTLGIAMGMGVNEPWAGIAALTPGILDAYRYFHPSARWARWASRISKMAMLIPLLK